MRLARIIALAAGAIIALQTQSSEAVPRSDIIWARRTTSPITLDGVLNESAWAQAESKFIEYGVDNGPPGSGYFLESSAPGISFPTDRTRATVKFLVYQNQLYMAASVPDSSVGGSLTFNRFDGLLMSIKNHADPAHPKPPAEYFYSWWKDNETHSYPDPQPVGELPNFRGMWGAPDPLAPRDSAAVANWDAVTVVNGLSNSDATIDQGYTVEMRFNLTPMGYDVTQPGGDVIEFNIQVYDNDFFWPLTLKFCSSRCWWQSPWGNAMWFNEVRIHARPDITTSTGTLPPTSFDVAIPELAGTAPTINGTLTEPVWSDPRIYDFDIRWDDNALRNTYPVTGRYRAGQFQPTVQGGQAQILDPGDCTVKAFYKGTKLYLGFDVRDLAVQFHPDVDRWDGFIVTLNDKVLRDVDQQLKAYRLSFRVDAAGAGDPEDDLATFVGSGAAQLALALKPGTTVDTLGANVDVGYTAELSLDLTAFGYPANLGDGIGYLGVNHLDGDSFLPVTDSYGSRTWWFREYPSQCCPAIVYFAPLTAVGAPQLVGSAQAGPAFARSIASPSSAPGIELSMPGTQRVTVDLYDVTGRLVESRPLGVVGPGTRRISLDGASMAAGVYLYNVRLADPSNGQVHDELHGKAVVVK